MSARKMTPAQVLREIAESDPVGHGQRLARAYGVGPEPTVQVPVSLLRDAHGLIRHSDTYSDERAEQIQARLGTLLSQPTPTAEPVQYNGHNGLAVFADAARRLNEGTTAAPPSIADMVPGTRAAIERADLVLGGFVQHNWASSTSVHEWYLGELRKLRDAIDPSTIRDVTPPSTESTK